MYLYLSSQFVVEEDVDTVEGDTVEGGTSGRDNDLVFPVGIVLAELD